jgi:hypothetical protein
MAQPPRRESFVEAPLNEPRLSVRAPNPAYQAYLILYIGFIAAPFKFLNVLVNWDQYLAPRVAGILPGSYIYARARPVGRTV